MWVEVLSRSDDGWYAGRLANTPRLVDDLDCDDLVRFDCRHVYVAMAEDKIPAYHERFRAWIEDEKGRLSNGVQ